MSGRRDLYLLGGLLLLLIGFTVFGPARNLAESGPIGASSYSSGPRGTLALLRWLRELGYDAGRLEYRAYQLDEQTAALIILAPELPIEDAAAAEILDWVERGGTLILADDRSLFARNDRLLLQALGAEHAPYGDGVLPLDRVPLRQPVFSDPALTEFTARTYGVLEFNVAEFAALAGPTDAVVLAGIPRGEGYVYLSSAVHPLTNAGLRETGNGELVLNLLRRIPPGAQILLDEYHHGFFTPPTQTNLLLDSPWGWAGLYVLVVLVLYLLLTARRFGRPVPLAEERARRSGAEYVLNMADLLQRGGKREYIVDHYHATLKRRLAQPYGINPTLNDPEFVAELARYREIEQARLLDLLTRLRRRNLSESELLQLVEEALRAQATAQP